MNYIKIYEALSQIEQSIDYQKYLNQNKGVWGEEYKWFLNHLS